MKQVSAKTKGFSLAEVIVTMALFGIVMTAVASASLLFSRLYLKAETQAEFDRNLRYTSQLLGRDARMASSIQFIEADDIRITRSDGMTVYYYVDSAQEKTVLIRRDSTFKRIVCRDIDSVIFSPISTGGGGLQCQINLLETSPIVKETGRTIELTFTSRL